MTKENEYEPVGNNDLRFQDATNGGFHHIVLRDADDYDTIVVNEDDIPALIKRLQEHVEEYKL